MNRFLELLNRRVYVRVVQIRTEILLSLFVSTLVFFSVFPLGFMLQSLGISLLYEPELIAEAFGFGDSGSYLKAALELNYLNGLTQDKHWVINLWPPGMVLLNGLLIHFFGSSYAVAYSFLVALSWSVFISVFSIKVRKVWGTRVSLLASALILVSGPFQFWIFHRGLFYAEGFAQLFFLMSLIAAISGSRADKLKVSLAFGVLSGTFLALAAYFRASFSTLEIVLLGSAVLAFLVWVLLLFRQARVRHSYFQRLAATLSIGWLAMHILMEPWLRFTAEEIRGVRTWSVVGEGFLRGVWVQRDEQVGWLAAGGVGWGCEINPKFCEAILDYQSTNGQPYPLDGVVAEMVSTILMNPFIYIGDRLNFISKGWFSVEFEMGSLGVVFGLIALFGFILVMVGLVRGVMRGEYLFLLVIAMALVLSIPQMIGHIEPRYLIPLKLLVFIYPWLVSVEKNLPGQLKGS